MFGFDSILYRYNLPARGGRIGFLVGLPFFWSARARQRRALESLDDRMLRDIGIGRIEADLESRKPFWQA